MQYCIFMHYLIILVNSINPKRQQLTREILCWKVCNLNAKFTTRFASLTFCIHVDITHIVLFSNTAQTLLYTYKPLKRINPTFHILVFLYKKKAFGCLSTHFNFTWFFDKKMTV